MLAVGVAVIGLSSREGSAAPETGPLAVVPLDAPGAAGPECAALVAGLPGELPSAAGPLPPRPIAAPAPVGVRAWAAVPQPVVLRCGLARPAELSATSALLEVDGVSWLVLDEGLPVVTYVAVDRPVYVALTAPTAAGTGPLQAVTEAVRTVLPETPVAVR